MSTFTQDDAARLLIPQDLLARAASLHLALHMHSKSVSVAIFEMDPGPALWQQEFAIDAIHQDPYADAIVFLKKTNWNEKVFRKSTISFDGENFTLVPSGFVIAGKEKELLQFNTQLECEFVESQSLEELGATVISEVPAAIHGMLSQYPNARILPVVTLLLKYIQLKKNLLQDQLHIYVQPNYLLVVAVAKGEMKLTNHFGIQGNDDVLYHLANACIRLGIDLQNAHIHLYGGAVSAELITLVKEYALQVEAWKGTTDKDSEVISFAIEVHTLCA